MIELKISLNEELLNNTHLRDETVRDDIDFSTAVHIQASKLLNAYADVKRNDATWLTENEGNLMCFTADITNSIKLVLPRQTDGILASLDFVRKASTLSQPNLVVPMFITENVETTSVIFKVFFIVRDGNIPFFSHQFTIWADTVEYLTMLQERDDSSCCRKVEKSKLDDLTDVEYGILADNINFVDKDLYLHKMSGSSYDGIISPLITYSLKSTYKPEQLCLESIESETEIITSVISPKNMKILSLDTTRSMLKTSDFVTGFSNFARSRRHIVEKLFDRHYLSFEGIKTVVIIINMDVAEELVSNFLYLHSNILLLDASKWVKTFTRKCALQLLNLKDGEFVFNPIQDANMSKYDDIKIGKMNFITLNGSNALNTTIKKLVTLHCITNFFKEYDKVKLNNGISVELTDLDKKLLDDIKKGRVL